MSGSGGDDMRMVVADVEHADAADEVDVLAALLIPDVGALALGQDDGVRRQEAPSHVGLAALQPVLGFGCFLAHREVLWGGDDLRLTGA